MELIQRLQTSQPSDDATSIKSAASNADSGRGASDEGDARQRLLRASATASGLSKYRAYIISGFRHTRLHRGGTAAPCKGSGLLTWWGQARPENFYRFRLTDSISECVVTMLSLALYEICVVFVSTTAVYTGSHHYIISAIFLFPVHVTLMTYTALHFDDCHGLWPSW